MCFFYFFPQPKFASQEEVLLGLKTKLEFDGVEFTPTTPDLKQSISLKEFKALNDDTKAMYNVKILAREARTPPLRRSG